MAFSMQLAPVKAGHEKRFVYIIRTAVDTARHYTGITSDVASRIDWHNHGPCGCTVHHRPWSLVVAIEFSTEVGRADSRNTSSRDPVGRFQSGTSLGELALHLSSHSP